MGQDQIRPFDGDLTFVGKLMAALPIDIELSRLIALRHAFGLVMKVLLLAHVYQEKVLIIYHIKF
jgi:HrpA-like RNA helicase